MFQVKRSVDFLKFHRKSLDLAMESRVIDVVMLLTMDLGARRLWTEQRILQSIRATQSRSALHAEKMKQNTSEKTEKVRSYLQHVKKGAGMNARIDMQKSNVMVQDAGPLAHWPGKRPWNLPQIMMWWISPAKHAQPSQGRIGSGSSESTRRISRRVSLLKRTCADTLGLNSNLSLFSSYSLGTKFLNESKD